MTEVVAALIWDGDRFLICQRPAHKARGLLWEFVGGKVESGETRQKALVRECQEELGITLDVGDVFYQVDHVYPDITIHLTLFHATIAQGTPKLLEHNDLRWITVRRWATMPSVRRTRSWRRRWPPLMGSGPGGTGITRERSISS